MVVKLDEAKKRILIEDERVIYLDGKYKDKHYEETKGKHVVKVRIDAPRSLMLNDLGQIILDAKIVGIQNDIRKNKWKDKSDEEFEKVPNKVYEYKFEAIHNPPKQNKAEREIKQAAIRTFQFTEKQFGKFLGTPEKLWDAVCLQWQDVYNSSFPFSSKAEMEEYEKGGQVSEKEAEAEEENN